MKKKTLDTIVFGILYAVTVVVATYVIMEKANAQGVINQPGGGFVVNGPGVITQPGGGFVINTPSAPAPRPVRCYTNCIGTFCSTTCY